MSDPQLVLGDRVQRALAAAFGADYADADPVIRPSQFADYQANVALALARRLGKPPREVAAAVVDALEVADVCAAVDISGPGFVNLTLRDDWIADRAADLLGDPRLGAPEAATRQVVPIDYSAPNVAKEMHVGHLRTTVVGDALARTLEFRGHHVIRQNHIGDWGTPFGMLIEHLLEVGEKLPRGRAARVGPERLLPGRPHEVRQRRRVRRSGAPPGGHAAGRRPRDAAALARARRPVEGLLQPGLRRARRHSHR